MALYGSSRKHQKNTDNELMSLYGSSRKHQKNTDNELMNLYGSSRKHQKNTVITNLWPCTVPVENIKRIL